MFLRSKPFALGIASVLFLVVLVTTRVGVFIVFEIASIWHDGDNYTTTYADAPVEITHVIERMEEIILPDYVQQVSGLIVREKEVVLLTDQTELFFLNPDDTKTTTGENLFPYKPPLFRQGTLEAITEVNDNYWVTGEIGVFLQVDKTGEIVGDTPVPAILAQTDITGLAWANGALFVTADDKVTLTRFDLATGEVVPFPLDFANVSNQDIAETTFMWQGVSHEGGRLYLVAENYPLIVVADAASGKVLETIGVPGRHAFSDIAVSNGMIFVPSDHNYFDPRPPLLVFPVPTSGGLVNAQGQGESY